MPDPKRAKDWPRGLWSLTLLLLFGSALFLRVQIARGLEHPGHGDPAFYYQVAENFAQRGRLEIDYIWHFLSPPESLTHPAGDYWMVFSSVLMSLPLFFGGGLFGATCVAIVFGLLCGAAILGLGRALSTPRVVTAAACAFVLFEPNLFNFSTSPNAPVFYTAFVTASLAFAARGSREPRAFLWAGLCAGLAHATRQDGLFLAPALAVAILSGSADGRRKRRALLEAAVAYLLAMAPVFLGNLIQLGAPLPSSLSRTVFAQSYEDIYAYAKPLNWETYRAWGWEHIWDSKRAVLASNGVILRDFLGWLLWIFVGVGLVRVLLRDRERRPVVLAALALLACQYSFYSLIGTAVATEGAFLKAGLALVPFLVLVAFDSLARAFRSAGGGAWGAWTPALASALLIGLAAPKLTDCLPRARKKVGIHNRIGTQVEALAEALEASRSAGDPEPVLMTRHPWEVHTTTGYGAVQVPNDDLETIFEVAARYGVTHLVLPVPRDVLTFQSADADPRLELAARIEGTPVRIYRLR